MPVIKFPSLIDREVERLFSENPPIHGKPCRNPVTGGGYMGGLDPIEEQKDAARRALLAREWFREHGPADLQPLPLGYWEREALKDKSAAHIVALYARSLAEQKYDVLKHPSFHDYACGTMASEFQGLDSMKKNPELLKRFPPRHLDGLGPGLYWLPPKEHAEEMGDYRRSKAWAASYAARQGDLGNQQ
jgi:hypothetical protein